MLSVCLQVDLYRECPFWQEDGSCMNRACGVETTDEVSAPPGLALRMRKLMSRIRPSVITGAHPRGVEVTQADRKSVV